MIKSGLNRPQYLAELQHTEAYMKRGKSSFRHPSPIKHRLRLSRNFLFAGKISLYATVLSFTGL